MNRAFPGAAVGRPSGGVAAPLPGASRRRLLAALGACAVAAGLPGPVRAAAPVEAEVWRDPGCGCCGAWLDHLREAGFAVREHATAELDAVRARLGMPARYASCHTARVGGYLVEGHVPAEDIRRLLRERPVAVGLAVPGMPAGSPGMEMPGGSRDPFDTLLVSPDASARVFASHRGQDAPRRRS